MNTKYISLAISASPYAIVGIGMVILLSYMYLSFNLVQYDQKTKSIEIALQGVRNNIIEMSNSSVVFEDNLQNISYIIVLDKVDVNEEKKVALSQ